MKKALSLALALVLAISLLAACGGGNSQPASTGGATAGSTAPAASTPDAPTGEAIELEFWTLALQPTFTDFIQGLIDKYEADNPGITINWQDLPYDGLPDKFLTRTAGGNPPDVVNIWSQLAITYAGKGALLDLEANASEEQKSIYLEAAYDSARVGDGVYAFPWYATPNITVYNKELLAAGGITEVPTTYDELLDLAIPFYEATGAWLFTPSSMYHMFYSYGIPMVSEDKKTAVVNTPEALALLEKLLAVGQAGAINLEPGTWDNWDNERQVYANGMVAMIVGGPQTVTRLQDEAPQILEVSAIEAAVLGPAEVSGEAIMNVVISNGTKHPQEAIAFANYITNDENQLAFCKEVSIFPTTTIAAADPYFQSDMESLEGQANYYASLSAQKAVDMTLGLENDQDVKLEIDNIMDAIFSSGTDPQTALANAEARVNELLAMNP